MTALVQSKTFISIYAKLNAVDFLNCQLAVAYCISVQLEPGVNKLRLADCIQCWDLKF